MTADSKSGAKGSESQVEALCVALRQTVVVCIGDIMLDRYVYGSVDRISPEAPIPVLQIDNEHTMPGGAGNVARNLAALGSTVRFFSVIGDDAEGGDLFRMLDSLVGSDSELAIEQERLTTVKTRFISESQQVLRVDRETTREINEATVTALKSWLKTAMPGAGAVVISDYGKGMLSDAALAAVFDAAASQGVPVIVDPKGRDYTAYRGALLVSPNLKEFYEATGTHPSAEPEFASAAVALQRRCGIDNILITRGADGMLLVDADGTTTAIATVAQEVFDVSGAGDTTIATLAASIAAGAALPVAADLANLAAGIAVSKLGTAAVSNLELSRQAAGGLRFAAKIVSPAVVERQLDTWRTAGLTIGFTNGCFDLLHPGHVSMLHRARARCDRLIVGLNTDNSVERLKGPGRPVQNESSRAIVLASLADVDAVVLFDDDTPLQLIETIRPDLLFKGADYTLETVVGAGVVAAYGGRVELISLEPNQSTSALVNRMAGAGDTEA